MTRNKVRKLLETGMTSAEVARQLGLSPATVCYHKHQLGFPLDSRCARRHDWAEIQRYYDAGHSLRQCQAAYGFSRKSWYDAVQRGAIIARPAAMPLEQLLARKRKGSRHHIKVRLISAGLKRNECEECGLTEWRGEPLSLALHHINGDGNDNRLENLSLLCPNCHSQTPNFGVKNVVRLARAEAF
jgi:5-methylcytosine-specific restriction endonuclease McrA